MEYYSPIWCSEPKYSPQLLDSTQKGVEKLINMPLLPDDLYGLELRGRIDDLTLSIKNALLKLIGVSGNSGSVR